MAFYKIVVKRQDGKKDSFEIWVIPHTIKFTNLSKLKKNDLVNVEIDILSKYIKKFVHAKK